ncbi:hypothetical protein AB1Y20_005333 [Prymnesium parvum]|uniref:RNA-directed RNA polymerase n=1 Tax=Prymnesium parvum TaxID=97485 RepID=A0AB34J5X6_PRYPA
MLKANGFFAVQARERWSISEDLIYRPGHHWLAQAPDMLEVRKITKRETINGQSFNVGDYMIRIGRYFDRDACDLSGLTFEEWQPELVFTPDDVGSKISISQQGHIKIGRLSRPDVFWDDVTPPMLSRVTILSVNNDSGSINFSMEPLDRPTVQPRKGGRRAAVVSAPLPKRYRMHAEIDAMIRARCW